MNRFGWFLFGVLATCAAALAAVEYYIQNAHGFSAREQPGAMETSIARWARSAAIPADAKSLANPVANTTEVMADARAHWADHCAICHANDGSGNINIGKRTWPPAPDMRQDRTQQMTDGELFYIIQNGIRFSAMPAWGGGSTGGSAHDEEDSWKLVRFIRHLPQLTVAEQQEMQKLNPKSPDEIEEEKEEEKFLKGEDSNEPQKEHHHH